MSPLNVQYHAVEPTQAAPVTSRPERPLGESFRARAQRVMPGGVSSNVRLGRSWAFFDRGEGAWLWDVDGNSHVDYVLGMGPAFLGHAPDGVTRAVSTAIGRGTVFGGQNLLELEAAETLKEALAWPDLVRFGGSGTEVVQAGIRLCRAVTGRTTIVLFQGHYHGWVDNVFHPGSSTLVSPGQDPRAFDAIVLPWNDIDALSEAFSTAGDRIAAVLMEPIMLNTGAIAPHASYLSAVRELCTQNGAIFFFDEVITGFRSALGGAVERYGVVPDLAAYGKAMASGFPVAALAGKDDILNLLKTGVTHSGTFNGNTAAMAATLATINSSRTILLMLM